MAKGSVEEYLGGSDQIDHPDHPRRQLILVNTASISSSREEGQRTAASNQSLGSLLPATTGLRFGRHHDRKNHLDVLYPVAVAGELLVLVGRPPFLLYTLHEFMQRVIYIYAV